MLEKIKNSVIKNGRRNKYLLPFAVAILFTFHVGERVVRTCTNLSEETLIALWRGKLRRGMALALCFCMIVTMVPPSALAKEKEAENEETVISGFAALPDDVREQTVPIGTSLEELNLPETMEAVYFVPEESTKPLEETSESMDETTDSTEETIPDETTDSTEETIPEGTTDPTEQPDEEESKVPETETESEEGSTSEIETEAETGESSAPAEENNQEESAAPAKENEQEETNLSAKLEVFSTTVKSPQYLAMPNDIPAGEIMILSEQEVLSKTSSSDEISSSEVTVTGVIWVSDPAYDGETEGEYIFTPVLPDGYVVEKGVILPEIIVTVSESLPDEMTEMVAKLLALIDALPAPADAFEQSDKPWRADVEAAEAARAALTDEQRAALPEEAVQKLDDLLHFLEVEGDCVDFGCPWHYPPELLKLMNKNEMPAPLTMDNLIEDYGVAQPRLLFAARTATYPQTLIVTSDNENNAHRGIADGDLDRMFNCWDNSHPIEVRFELDQVPSQSAYLAIRAFDIDSGEDNKVYVNGTKVGQLSGMSDTWNITVLEIPTRLLKTGKNYVEIKLDKTLYMNVMLQKVPVYSARVDWMQLVLDGGTADSGITGFEIKLDEPFNSGKYAQIPVTATITQSGTTQYNTEYTLKKGSSTLDIGFSNTSGKENVTLRLPKDCASGLYEIVALVKDPVTGEVKARERVNFYHVKNVGAELSPKITHTLTPNGPTNRNVEINITVEDNMGYTDVSIEAGNHHTVDANKDYMYWVSYTVGNSRRRFEYTVPVNNIDKTPPVITYTPFSVEEGIVDAEISRLFEKALCVTEDGQLAGEPSCTLPENFAATMGEKTVTVTATDAAGNTATKDCVITVLPLSVRLTQQTPVRVDATDRFTLSATLEDTGGLSFTETGFVWGVMQNPTIRICNGRLATDSPVTTRGGSITVTAPDIVDGVDYYARAYTLAGGRVYYSDQMRFSIGEKKYGVFRVQNQGGGTFTITRSDGFAEEQTVYYRTVNGSAVGGTHFTHRSGSVVFAQGETSKTVTVEEAKVDAVYGGNSATGYSNADRTYQLEIYRVQGGGTIAAGGARATRTMPKNADKTIDRSIYEYRQAKEVSNLKMKIREKPVSGYDETVPIDGLTCAALNGSVYPGVQATYLSNTASAMRFQLKDFNAWDDDWTIQRYILFSNISNAKFASGKGAKIPELSAKGTKCVLIYSRQGDTNSTETTTFDFPRSNGTVLGTGSSTAKNYAIRDAKWEDGQDPSGDYVLFNLNETCFIALGSYNHAPANSFFYFNSAKLFCAPHDTREPQVMGIAPMAGGLYKPGDSITVSLVFDEIVDGTNSSLSGTTIDTNYGTMTYAGGADTNVLYYTGTVPIGASGAVTLNSFSNSGSIRDMCKDDGTVSDCSGSKTTIEVDGIQPTVNIKAGGIKDGTATGTITATNSDLLQYTWTQSAAMPVAGWLTCANGDNVQTRQLSGEWYLHTLATRSTNGATAYARQSFHFGTLENPVSPLPTLTLSADNTNWAHSRNITVTRTPADAGVAYAGPESGIAGGTVNVTRNGLYTFTLTSGDETITEQVLVSRLDDVAPTLTIQESGNTDAIYNELNFSASASDSLSGIAKVEYSWSDTTTSGGWTAAGGTGGSYTIPTYTATETTQSIKYLHVRATDHAGNVTTQVSQGYTVVKAPLPANLPAITLTGSPSAWTKGPVNLSWKVTGLGAGGIWVNVGESTSTQESGTLSADKNGLYSVMVTDKNRRSASATCLVNKIDAEAPVLGAFSCAPTGWAPKKTVTLSDVSDNRTPVFDADGNVTGYTGSGLEKQEWKQSGGEYMTFTGSSIDATANGIYTVRLTDQVGNQSEYAVAVSGIDNVAPTVSVGIPATDWTSAAQNIKITYTDQTDGSGIATAQYAITTTASGAKPTTLSNLPTSGQSISVSANGTSYIYYKVTDNAGNVTEGYSNPIKVDTQTPTLTVTGGTSGAKNQTLTVISAFGTSNGKVAVSKDGGTAADVTGNSYLVTAKGAYTFTATSGAGKTATVIIHAYGITFDSKGGSLEPAQIVVKGGKATQPANPTKTGYTFTKWQKVGADYDFNTEINADITLAAAWTLDAPAVKLAVDHAETTYNGGSTVATLTATPEHIAAGVTYTYEWYRGSTKLNGTGSTIPLTDAVHSGSYTVKVTAADGTLNSTQVTSNTVTVTINKADTEITTAPTASGITYGQALSGSTLNGGVATAAATSFLGRLTHVFKSGASVPGTFSWTTGTINPAVSDSDSTDYSVTFTPTDTANYNSSTSTITLKVDKATLTPSVNTVSSKTYDGNAAASGTIVLAGAVLGESPAASGTFAFTDSNAGENKRVNVTGIALTGSWGGNYTLDKTELPNAATTAAIKPKTVGLNWHGYTGLVYDTNAVHVTATATELIGADVCTVTVTGGTETNAGSYTATATAVNNSNYKLPTTGLTQGYTIAKAPVSFVVSDNVYDYDVSAKSATVVQTAGETPDVSGKFTVSYKKDGAVAAAPTAKGIYDVMVTLNDPNFKHETSNDVEIQVGNLTINGVPYPDEITWPTAAAITYGQTLDDSALTGGVGVGTFSWEVSDTVPTVQNSGYTVIFTPTDTSYTPEGETVSITVSKATPTLTLPAAGDITYGETLADSGLTGGSASATVGGMPADVPGSYRWTAPETMPKFADSNNTEYALTFTPTDTANYNVVKSGKVTLAVAQKPVSLTWAGHTELIYNGAPVSVTATATGLVGSDICTVTVTDGAKTDAGNYTATATGLSNDNYTLPDVTTQSYTIAKAPVSFVVSDNVYDYDVSAKSATVVQTAGETPDVSGKFTVSYKKDGAVVSAPTAKGIYDVMVTLNDPNFKHKTSNNVEIQVGNLTINGVPYPDEITWPTAAAITYGQTLDDSALTGGVGVGTFSWEVSDTVPTVQNSGYTVIFTPTDTSYTPEGETVSITVSKATPTLTLPAAGDITYGETLADSGLTGGSASATVGGMPADVPGSYRWTAPETMPKFADSNNTEYDLTFTPTDTANYNVVKSGKVTLAVAQKPVSLTWAGHTELIYNGAPVSVTATATGLVGSDICTVTVTDGAKTDAGNYTATATGLSNDNYTLPDVTTQSYTIAQKPVKVLWSDMFPTYDGAAKFPTVALEGVLNDEDCTVSSTGSTATGDAGRYKVKADLQGARSGNYTMTNPNEILTIQPAPVSVSLSDYSHKYDGTAKAVTFTAAPKAPLIITYRLAGNVVVAPTEEGIYDIHVGLESKNYRFADGTDGKPRRMGVLTIYKERPPELYTVTFAPGAENAVGTAPTLPTVVRDTVHILPGNTFQRAGYAFTGWMNGNTIYHPGERFLQPANNTTVFTAQWEESTFDIGGVVDQDGKPVSNVRVVLMRGAEQIAETATNQTGEYHFDNVLPGLYNLVASKPSPDGAGDIIMTIMVEVKVADVDQANITLPNGKANSIVEVAPGTPKIIVGNLDRIFHSTGDDFTPEDAQTVKDGGTVEIKFVAQIKQKSEIEEDAKEIAKEIGGAKIGLYLALDVEKTVTQPVALDKPDEEPSSKTTVIPETSVLLESVIPLPGDLQDKQSYTVYRIHDGAVDVLTTDGDSGERIEVSADKTTLTLYAQKFSTYAVVYTEKSVDGKKSKTKSDLPQPSEPIPVAPVAPVPETSLPDDMPNTDKQEVVPSDKQKTTLSGEPETDNENKAETGDDVEQEPGGSDKEGQENESPDLESAIRDLPDELTDGTQKPFVLASALLALIDALLAVFALRKLREKRRKLLTAIFAALAVSTFLLTTGRNGFVFANWWTLVIAAFTIGMALCVGAMKKEDDPAS